MQIDILILEEEPQKRQEVIDFFKVGSLIQALEQQGIFPKIVTTLEQIKAEGFYLYFNSSTFDKGLLAWSPRIVVMNVSMSEVEIAAKDFHFAAIVRYLYYRDHAPFIFGFGQLAEKLDTFSTEEQILHDFGSGEIYTLMRPRDLQKRPFVTFLLEYLQVYQAQGLHQRKGTVADRGKD